MKKTEIVNILLANLNVDVTSNLDPLLYGEFDGRAIIKTIQDTGTETSINYEIFDYLIFDPISCDEVNRTLLDEILKKKKSTAQVIILTVYDNEGSTADSVFKSMGIKKIIRIPVSWAEFKLILFG